MGDKRVSSPLALGTLSKKVCAVTIFTESLSARIRVQPLTVNLENFDYPPFLEYECEPRINVGAIAYWNPWGIAMDGPGAFVLVFRSSLCLDVSYFE